MPTLRRALGISLATFGALVLLIIATPITHWCAVHSADGWDDRGGEVLVVLGGAMLVPAPSPQAVMGEDTYLRCVYASWILEHSSFRYVIVSGGGGLAPAMQRWLQSQGTAGAHLVQENASRSTYENAAFTKRLLQRLFPGRSLPAVTVLTSDFHSYRARRTFEAAGLKVRMIAIPDLIKRSANWRDRFGSTVTLCEEALKVVYYKAAGKL